MNPTQTEPVPALPATADSHNGVIDTFLEMLRTLIPVVDRIKSTIEQSSNTIPRVSNQLDKVTQATELATVEILNVLEAMSTKIDQVDQDLKGIEGWISAHTAWEQKIFAANPQLEPPPNGEPHVLVEAMRGRLSTTRDDSMNIAMALQVQDITSQQLAGVSHLIEEVRGQLAWALRKFDSRTAAEDPATAPVLTEGQGKAFDMNASYTSQDHRQSDADAIIQQWAVQAVK